MCDCFVSFAIISRDHFFVAEKAYNSIDRQYMTQNAKLVRVIEVDIPNLNRLLDEVDLDPVTTNID